MNDAGDHQPKSARRILRQISSILAQCADAQRTMAELSFAPDRYVLGPADAPDTYAEFLYRTSGPLRHEPPASKRVAS